MKKPYRITGTVVEVFNGHSAPEIRQCFNLVCDQGKVSSWVQEGQGPLRIGYRVKLTSRERPVPQFAVANPMHVAGISHDRSAIHPWFEGDTARQFLAGMVQAPHDLLPRGVLGDHLAIDQAFDGARFLARGI